MNNFAERNGTVKVQRCTRRVCLTDHVDLGGGRSNRHHLNYEVVLVSSTQTTRTSTETAQLNRKGSVRHNTHTLSVIRRGWNTTPWDSGNCVATELISNIKEDSVKQTAQTSVTQQKDLWSSNWWTKECYDLNTVNDCLNSFAFTHSSAS